jgi:hypothetical protein
MKNGSALPLVATLVVTLAACGGSTTGGSGEGGAGGGGAGGGGGGGGGGGNACGVPTSSVFACALPEPLPASPPDPWTFVSSGTVAAVRPPDADEPCASSENYHTRIGYGDIAPEVMIDLVDANGNALTLGFAVPGFTSSAVAVGDLLDVDFSMESVTWGGKIARLRVERGGQLVVAVGENDPVGLTIGEAASECYEEDQMCGYEEFEMAVQTPDGASASLPNDATAEVGELTVTNDRYFHNYDTSGGCNFGLSVEYLVGVAPTP